MNLKFIFLIICYLGSSLINTIAQTSDTTVEKIFSMDIEELMNTKIITAGKKPEKISEIPASVVLLTREDIKAAGYTDLAQVLENIPGMFIINDYYWGFGTFGVRGFWPGSDDRNIMILVNGVNQIYDITSNYIINNVTVSVEAIDRIEVVRGPMSVIYGSGAFYGVINIITNEAPKPNEPKSEISASTGSLNTEKLFGRTAGSQGDFNYTVNASYYNTRGIDQPVSKMVRDTSFLKNYGVPNNYTTGGRLENNQKYMGISCSYKPFTFDFSYNESTGEGYYLYPSPFTGSPTKATIMNAFVDFKKNLSRFITIEGKLTYNASRMLTKFDYLFNDFYGIQQHESNALEGEFDAFLKLSDRLDVTLGLYSRSILNAYNMYDIPSFGASTSHQYFFLKSDSNIIVRSTFAQINYQPFANLKFVAGLRLEQMPEYTIGQLIPDSSFSHFKNQYYRYKQTNIAPIPRFAIIWSLTERNIFKLLYGQAINRPSFFQNTANNLNTSLPILQPEWITTYELNYISNISDKLMINAGIFYNTLEKLISRSSEIDSLHNYKTWFGNAGKLVTMGEEITIQAKILKKLRLEISATYQKTKDKRKGFENIEVAYSPELLGYLKATYNFSQNMTFAVSGNYVGSMFPFYDETIMNKDSTYGVRIGDKVNAYFLLGANLRIENIIKHGYYLNLKCDNVLNQVVRYPTTSNNNWADRGTMGAGRIFLVSFGKKFY